MDDELKLTVDPGTSFWDFAGLGTSTYDNPWASGSKMAPFDQKVGGCLDSRHSQTKRQTNPIEIITYFASVGSNSFIGGCTTLI